MGAASSSAAAGRKGARVADLQAAVLGQRQALGDGWLAAVERGAVDVRQASLGQRFGTAAPSATPYFDMAMRGGSLADWDIDLSGARPLNWAGFQRLVAAGVPQAFAAQLNAAGDVLAAQVQLEADGSFTIGGPDGRLLLVVRGADGAPVDVLAFRLDAPGEVAWFYPGLPEGLLGAGNLPDGRDGFAGRVMLVETPLDWLRGGGAGGCVYHWAGAWPTLRSLGEGVTIEAAPALASVLRARVERGGLPLVASATSGAGLSLAERIGRGL